MRPFGAFVLAFAILATFGACIALIGRAADWSPFALVMLGALAGFLIGFGMTVALYATDPEGDAAISAAYLDGWEDARRDRIDSRRADRIGR